MLGAPKKTPFKELLLNRRFFGFYFAEFSYPVTQYVKKFKTNNENLFIRNWSKILLISINVVIVIIIVIIVIVVFIVETCIKKYIYVYLLFIAIAWEMKV